MTSDVVAVIELVKNSYDAYARNVHLQFGESLEGGTFLEILDDGCGMTRDTIENAWCLVATPHKQKNPVAKGTRGQRRVTGEKGLGRLSAARLGSRLYMQTKASEDICWEVKVDWLKIAETEDMSRSFAICEPCQENSPLYSESGTCIRIHNLSEQWDEDKIHDLEENLARLISPFSGIDDFKIFLAKPSQDRKEEVEISAPDFLSKPIYCIRGNVDAEGSIEAHYEYAPLKESGRRSKDITHAWSKIRESIALNSKSDSSPQKACCGPFKYEIRAWDINRDDISPISEHFGLKRSQIRKAIRAHKGISVYRDDVLVLPKSEGARDWLGLDLRRVSLIGVRLSTNQIVGYVSISADRNPDIKDTSDRERLASGKAELEFKEILKAIVSLLEKEREADRETPEQSKPLHDLFESMDTKSVLSHIKTLSDEGEPAGKALPLVRTFGQQLDSTRKTLQKRFVYYSRLATVGTIAHMLVHEIRNRTFAFGRFLETVKDRGLLSSDKGIQENYKHADHAVDSLEKLADTFSPLASRNFKRGRRHSTLEDRIKECLILNEGEIRNGNVKLKVPDSQTKVAVDPGELDAILLNLITNAVYWMRDVPENERELCFEVKPIDEDLDRIQVCVRDTGPGIDEEDVERIFMPGVTRKPDGIGMGLTVASELVSMYNGRMRLEYDAEATGASFAFDLPLSKRK